MKILKTVLYIWIGLVLCRFSMAQVPGQITSVPMPEQNRAMLESIVGKPLMNVGFLNNGSFWSGQNQIQPQAVEAQVITPQTPSIFGAEVSNYNPSSFQLDMSKYNTAVPLQ